MSASDTVHVRMAHTGVVEGQAKLKTTLGSCVGIIMHDGKAAVSGLAHIMLPIRAREDPSVGKYADTAIPHLLAEVIKRGARRENLRAFVTGGASMFRTSEDRGIASVGEQNVAATRRILKELGVPIIHEDIGGERGRTVIFDNGAGRLEVRTLK